METKLPDGIKNIVKDTVGYAEAENKESFNVGASVAFSKAEDYYEKIIKDLVMQRDGYKSAAEQYRSDLTNLSTIIKRYTTDE